MLTLQIKEEEEETAVLDAGCILKTLFLFSPGPFSGFTVGNDRLLSSLRWCFRREGPSYPWFPGLVLSRAGQSQRRIPPPPVCAGENRAPDFAQSFSF